MTNLTEKIYSLLVELSTIDPEFNMDEYSTEFIDSATNDEKRSLYEMLYSIKMDHLSEKYWESVYEKQGPLCMGNCPTLEQWVMPHRNYLVRPIKRRIRKVKGFQKFKKAFWEWYYSLTGSNSQVTARASFMIQPLTDLDDVSKFIQLKPNVFVRPNDYEVLARGNTSFPFDNLPHQKLQIEEVKKM